jgi:diguanylate cyclase (GGDEF)-like protein
MRIVLVDSSRTVLRIVGDQIKHGGHDVRPFTDGREALHCLMADTEVRALITSTTPHSLSGVELCSEARAFAGHRRPIYIILMSSSDEHRNVVRALDNGADDFMHKPPIAEELRARLRAADRVTSMQVELIRYATTDSLTGLLTRRAFFERLADLCATPDVDKTAVMFDIDHFKRINDVHGHQAGDAVLRAVAEKAASLDAVVGRLGGEEFCAVVKLPLPQALKLAEDLRAAIADIRLPCSGQVLAVTSSFGVSQWQPEDNVDQLLARADAALYRAKQSGRNRVVAADPCQLTSDDDWQASVRVAPRGEIRSHQVH